MKPRLTAALATFVVLLFVAAIGTAPISAQQGPTPTPEAPVPTPTPHPELERRIYQLEAAKDETIKSLELINEQNRHIITGAGALITLLIAVQAIATGIQLHREGKRDKAERTGVEQVSDVMNVVERTLESRLTAEKEAREEAKKARSELQEFQEQVKSLQHFYQNFQKTIKSSRKTIKDRASELAQTSRHDFRGMASALDDFAQQVDRFKAEFETLEEEPRPSFSARVPYIRGIAAHYANQPKDTKQYLEEVVRFREPEPDEIKLAYTRRVANAYYYLGLTESNFGNHQDAIAFFEKANELDLQDRDFLTRVVTAESYVMTNEFDRARPFLDYVEIRLNEIERQQGYLRNFHLRLRSRAALVRVNMAILEHKDNWREEAQRLLEPVHAADPLYYYATATLAQVYHEQRDYDKAQELFNEAYRIIERSGQLLKVTEARSRILLLTTAGLCCKHGPADESRSEKLLDEAYGLLGSLPKMDDRVCTVFSTLSKQNEASGTIGNHIERMRKGQVLLGPGD